jgi:ATP adenylyltransferase
MDVDPSVRPPGSLRSALAERAGRALRSGALQPIPTECELVEHEGVEFVVRVVAGVRRKREETARQQRAGTNPFLPPDPELVVAELSDSHRCVLNKFPALENHVLIVTRSFETQEGLLTPADFEATWTCLTALDGLAFYNSDAVAGASQRHRHLQVVPLPLGPGRLAVPIEARLEPARAGCVAPGLPFVHALARLDEGATHAPRDAGRTLHAAYLAVLRAADCGPHAAAGAGRPYNLLVTPGWMLAVPRTRAAFESVEVNALGFGGSLLVQSRERLARVKAIGPMTILRRVAVEAPVRDARPRARLR